MKNSYQYLKHCVSLNGLLTEQNLLSQTSTSEYPDSFSGIVGAASALSLTIKFEQIIANERNGSKYQHLVHNLLFIHFP